MCGFNVFDQDSWLDSFVRRQSSRLVKFYTLESETNKFDKSASQEYQWTVLKNGKSEVLKHAQLCSRDVLEQKKSMGRALVMVGLLRYKGLNSNFGCAYIFFMRQRFPLEPNHK